MKAPGFVLLLSALLIPCSVQARSFAVAASDPHPRTRVIGELIALTPTQLVVDTPDGEVPLLLDSRTVLPTDLSLGDPVAVEFRVIDNGSLLANRIVPYRGPLPTRDAVSVRTDGEPDVLAEPAVASNAADTVYPAQTTSSEPAPVADAAPTVTTDEADELPQTASPRPLLGLAGGAALGAAALMALVRRRRTS